MLDPARHRACRRGLVPFTSCEWNLDLYEPERHRPEQGWRWFDRLTHRIAYRLTRNQYTALAGRTVDRPGWGGARICLLVASVVLLAGVVGMFLFGVYLVVDGFPSWWMLPGGFLILLAIALRPRLGRLDPSARPLTRDEAATLFRLIDDVAAAIGTPAPHVVAVDSEFNAQAGVIGLGRRVLTIGLPLWGVLPPQQRVALVGHELGHFSNGDVRRGPLIGIAFTTLGKLSELLRPPYSPTGEHSFAIGESLTRGVMSILRSFVLSLHIVLVWVGLRDTQRAEYLADEMAARAAGSEAAAALADSLLSADVMLLLAAREARWRGGPAAWRAAADQARAERVARVPRLRQLSIRDGVSLFASHPPEGLRVRMIESRPPQVPMVALSEADSARIDEELAKSYEAVRRDLAAR